MRRKEYFFAETVARRPTLCDAIIVKFLNEARNIAHAPPQVFEEYGGAVPSQTSELGPLQVGVACGNRIGRIGSVHGNRSW